MLLDVQMLHTLELWLAERCLTVVTIFAAAAAGQDVCAGGCEVGAGGRHQGVQQLRQQRPARGRGRDALQGWRQHHHPQVSFLPSI